MNNVLGIINVTKENDELKELTPYRCHASLPYGGRYRLIDFLLSNMVHSKIRNVAIFTPPHYRTLMDHLGSGKDWDLEYKRDGLFIFPKTNATNSNQGDLSVLYQHLDYLEKSSQEYVLLSFGSLIINMDFQQVMKQHIDSGAEVTVLYKQKDITDSSYTNITMDDFYNITNFKASESTMGSLDIFILKKELLIQAIKRYSPHYSNLIEVLKQCDLMQSVKGYHCEGPVQKLSSIQEYYKSSMDLLNQHALKELVTFPNEIYTKLSDDPPTKYASTSSVTNSIIANGCVIEGEVENSILFNNVHVKKGATIKNSIVMSNSEIGEHSYLDKVIVDEEVFVLPEENKIGSSYNPKVVGSNNTVGAID